MREIQGMSLVIMGVLAILCDLWDGRIPNGLIASGLACGFIYQIFSNGCAGVILYLGGVLLPILLLGLLYYLRMIGAGDVKLFCAAGGFLGPEKCLTCIVVSMMAGGAISAVLMISHRSFRKRLQYLESYVGAYMEDHKWRSYMAGTGSQDRFCFSIPMLVGILYCLGGNI